VFDVTGGGGPIFCDEDSNRTSLNPFVWIEWTGAKGDGSTNSTIALTGAVRAAGDGKIIRAGQGVFLTDNFSIKGPNRVALWGSGKGEWKRSDGAVNDLWNATVFQCNTGQTGTFFTYDSDFSPASQRAANIAGAVKSGNFVLAGCSTTDIVMQVEYTDRATSFEDIWIGVHEDATDCTGLEYGNASSTSFRRIDIWHGAEGDRHSTHSTGYGLRVWNRASDTSYNITGITNANPAQVTAAGHPWQTNDHVYISGVVGMTEVNSQSYTITYVDANNFTLQGVDSSGYGVYASDGVVEPLDDDLYSNTSIATSGLFEDVRIKWFATGLMVGGDNTTALESRYLKELIFLYGGIEYGYTLVHLGTGVEGISFRGTHFESAGWTWDSGASEYSQTFDNSAAIYSNWGAHNVRISDCKFNRNSGDTEYAHLSAGKEIFIESTNRGDGVTASHWIIENSYFADVGFYGIYVEGTSTYVNDIEIRHSIFEPRDDGTGTALWFEDTHAIKNLTLSHVSVEYAGRTFATEITGGFNARRPTMFAHDIWDTGSRTLSTFHSGRTVVNTSQGGSTRYTLPDADERVPGTSLSYRFLQTNNDGGTITISVIPASGDSIDYSVTSADEYTLDYTGTHFVVEAVDDDNWISYGWHGSITRN
jgi:hypothetical protein